MFKTRKKGNRQIGGKIEPFSPKKIKYGIYSFLGDTPTHMMWSSISMNSSSMEKMSSETLSERTETKKVV